MLTGIDLKVDKGEFVAVVGPSGCGKSTLLNVISGLEEVDRGHVRVSGKDVVDEPTRIDLLRHRIGMARSAAHLWFMRADVAQVLCLAMGERPAHDAVVALTPLWGDRVPPGHREAQQRHRSLSRR
mgnify:CR=1 FL=1